MNDDKRAECVGGAAVVSVVVEVCSVSASVSVLGSAKAVTTSLQRQPGEWFAFIAAPLTWRHQLTWLQTEPHVYLGASSVQVFSFFVFVSVLDGGDDDDDGGAAA